MSDLRGRLFIVSAPSGGGKTSLTRALVKALEAVGHAAVISVSYTTRAPRPGEQEGVHYHFVDEPQFLEMVAQDEFLEHAEVFGRRYGTGRDRTEQLLREGVDVILDIDWQGAQQVRGKLSDVRTVFILPPSLEVLEARLRNRAQDDEATIAARMRQARDEMSHWSEYDSLIVNDKFEQALGELTALFVAPRLGRDEQAQRHARLLNDLSI